MDRVSQKLREELGQLVAPFKAAPWRVSVYGAAALVIMLLYLVQGSRGFFAAHISPGILSGATAAEIVWWATLYQFAAAFLLFFLVPAALLKFVAKENLRDLGLGLGDWKFGLVVVVLGLLFIALPGGLSTGSMVDFQAEYPLAKLATESIGRFALYQLAYGLWYYVAWEAFFRGFLQLGLRRHIGDLPAILVQTTASTLLHIGKPASEIWAALFAGFLFGVLVLRTRSIWPLVLVHWGLGLLTDLACANAMGLWR